MKKYPAFSEKLREALSQIAEDIPEQTDLFPRISQRLREQQRQSLRQEQQQQQWPRQKIFKQKKLRLAVALISLILLLSGFASAIPRLFQWLGDQPLQTITLDHATTIHRQVSDQGIILWLDQAYADGARTAVTFHVTSSSSLQPIPLEPVLTDAAGQTYQGIDGRQDKSNGLAEFLPLSLPQLRHSQLLTFTVHQMHLSGYNTHGQLVIGTWTIAFRITPQVGRLLTIQVAPLTRSGVTIQPSQLELAPSGIRLFLRISGLAPTTSLLTLTQFATRQGYDGTTPDGGKFGTGSTGEGALLQFRLPNGQVLEPVRVDAQSPDGRLLTSDRAVGSTGTAMLEVLFFTVPPSTQNPVTLTIDHVHIALLGNTTTPNEANGPWTFLIFFK